MIITLTGASGAGKSTIGEWLRKRFGVNLKPVVSITIREPRDDDPLGEYEYVSTEEFDTKRKAGEFIWWVNPFGKDFYGTLTRSLEETKLEPNTFFLMILEPDSVGKLHVYTKRMGLQVVSFYITVPSVEELRLRLKNRARQERDKKVSKMRAQGRSESDVWEWLKQQRKKDEATLEGRIQECLNWDAQALGSGIPYIFVKNDGLVQETVATIISVIGVFRWLPSKIDF